MEYNYLGETGLKVSNLCLGTMTFGNTQESCSEEEAHHILDEFVAAGGNFIDTADVYHMGVSEKILGQWLVKQPKRNKLIIATKLRSQQDPDDPNCVGLSRHHILHNIEQSLKRLQTDYIDLLYVHRWDAGTPIEETLVALSDLVKSGKVHYIGASNFTGWQVQSTSDISKHLGLAKFCCNQMQYNLIAREIEYEVTVACKREGVAILPWSPLKGGWLSGKMVRDQGPPQGSRVHAFSQEGRMITQSRPNWKDLASQERTWEILDTCKGIAESHNKTIAQVAIRWLLQKENVPSVVFGVKNVSQLRDNLGALGWKLTDQEMKQLDEISYLPPPYPYEMVDRLSKNRDRK